MKVRDYCLSAVLSFFGIAVPALAQTGNNPQDCKPEVKQIRDNVVSLQWNNAEPVYGIFDDFESHPDFAFNSPGEVGWSYLDMDNERTYTIGSYIYDNSDQPKAFQIWNPSQTIPPYTADKGLPHRGNKCLASMATFTGKRNDWIISPDLSDQHFTEDFTFSFWAYSMTSSYGLEKIKIGYSLTDKNINSFIFLNNGEPYEIPEKTREHTDDYYFSFRIPKEARYVAINCVTDGDGGQALFIDDIAIAVNKIMPNKTATNYLTGFNLYRDGKKINNELITQHSYTDTVPDFGIHTYQVESVFENGEPVKGISVNVDVPNIHLLPFVENFESYDFETNFWEISCPGAAQWEYITRSCFWSVSYKPYSLFKEAATFYPSNALQNYTDFCLISKELDASDLDSVMMCYDISLDAYELSGSSRNGEAIAVEVFDGTRWIKVDERRDDRGDYDYTRFYVDLSQYVAGKKFRIRFNAQGRSASNIISWYISYIRVYEKAKANVSGTVLCGSDPVPDALVRFTSDENDTYTVLTDENGAYTIADMDAHHYTVAIDLTGYNPYSDTLTITKGSKTIDINMTRPVISLTSASESHDMTAEATATGNISLQNTGNGTSRLGMWINYEDKTVAAEPSFEVLRTFNPSEILQASIGFDGEFFYMAKCDQYANDGLIYKYDKDNNLVGTFMPNIHLRKYLAMTFDGENFYIATGDSNIYIVNMRDGVFLGEIHTNLESVSHIAYDETQDAFWVGALNSLALVDKNGNTLRAEVVYDPGKVLFSGSAYDPYFKGGPCLWIMDRSRGNTPTTNLTSAVIRRIDLKDMKLKEDYAYFCDNLPGFQYGNNTIGPVWGEGLFGTTRYKDGHFVLMGVIMNSPGLVGILDMYEVPNWLKIDGYGFKMNASDSKQVAYTVDASSMLENDTRKATVTFRMDPYATPLQFEVNANINAKAQYAKPLALRAIAEKDIAAKLTWTAPQAASATPVSYNIYRNGEKIASSTTLTYTDNNLKAGVYSYTVSAVYAGNHESEQSHEAILKIKAGVACYAPYNLTAANVHNTSIALAWKDPATYGTQATILRWGNGINADGILGPDDFIGAASWSTQDLEPYHNMILQSVTFVPMTTEADFTLKIFENDELVYSQRIEEASIISKKPCTVTLQETYKINDRQELKVGIEVSNYDELSGDLALGLDAGPAVNRKGNWLYIRGVGWMTIGATGLTDVNVNITLNLEPKTDNDPFAKGYNIYRDGEKITNTPVTECQYSDPISTPGLYTYTVTAIHNNGESYACTPASARIVDISAHNAPEDLTARVSMNRNVALHWNNPNTHVASKSTSNYKPFGYISHFDVLQPAESAVVTDGQFIYTAHRNRNGEFHKYDMQGKFIETFTIEGVRIITDLTYDGTYFYGCGVGNTIYCLDFEQHSLIKAMTVITTARHLTYIPDLDNGKGGFELGDWTSSIFVNKEGTFIGDGYPYLDGAAGAAYHDGKIYYAQQGSAGLCEVMEVDFATLEATGNSTDLSGSKVLNLADNTRSGGLDMYMAANGTAVLLLVLQQPEPALNKIVSLEATQNAYVSGFNVYRDGTKINTEPIAVRDYTDVVTTSGDHSYTVSAIYVDEQESGQSAPVSITIVEPTHREAPVHVRAAVDKRNVRLQWTSVIDMGNRGDSMEAYTHLATGKVGDWITIDGDKMPVYISDDFAFQGIDKAKTFFIIDEEIIDNQNAGFAFSGKKAFVSAAAWDTEEPAQTDDWLITEAKDPVTGQTAKWISFMARGLEVGYKENFYLAYSTMGIEANNFIPLTAFPERVDYLWTRYTYQLPEDAKYVAIHYTSLDGRALFIDDVLMGSGMCPFTVIDDYGSDDEFIEAVVGYNIYRDGERLNTDPVKACTFFDGNLGNGEYTYEIQALYNTSFESPKSEPVKVKVKYESTGSAPGNLSADVVNRDVLLGWTEPFYDEAIEFSYMRSVGLGGAIGWTMASTYYVAYKWNPSDLMGVYGYRLDAVAGIFYIAPSELTLVIYQGGELVYEQDVTRECVDMSLSVFWLNTPYQIDFTKDLMVGFRISAEDGALSMLYSDEMADNGYGNLYSDDGSLWFSAYSYSAGQWKGNWFMVMLFDMGVSSLGGDFQGYRVYRNGSAISPELLSERSYTDRNVPNGTHSYQVAAVYSNTEKRSEPVIVRMTANGEDTEAALVNITPNPAHESVTVLGEYRKIEIVDVQGKVRLTSPAGKDGNLDISNLAAGVYFVRIETTRGQQVSKLIVW